VSRNLSERVIELLKETGKVSEADIQRALAQYSKEEGGKLRDVFVKMGLISERELLSLVSVELKIPFLNLNKIKINPELSRLVPEKLARKHQIVPISEIGNALTIAMSDPFNVFAIDDIAICTRRKVEAVISIEKDITDSLQRLYGDTGESMNAIAEAASGGSGSVEVVKGDEEGGGSQTSEAPVVKIVDLILKEALRRRASDIHIEPFEKAVRVRYRIDGGLEEALTIPKKNQNAVLTRLKIMSKLDITENRVPQDGRFKVKLAAKEVDFRVSILPVYFGSKVVMRVLDKGALSFGLENLGFFPDTLKAFQEAVAKPFGMILITGPTGSGKSTTLYSILSQLNTPERNVITIEDPIEYQVRGITQIQARAEIGLDFASGLRAILRQSPDVVMVGEIRDGETADIAIKASLTGQLVLSTLHTNDAAGAMTRLMDMGVEPFLIASSVVLVGAQRLCRKVCPNCKEKIEVPKEVFERLNVNIDRLAPDPAKRNFLKGKGCEKCNQTGYFGRMSVLEALTVDDAMRDMIVRKASAAEIREHAAKNGMTSLRDDALRKCAQGLTTLDEVLRITSEDE